MLKVGSNSIGKVYFGSTLIGKAYLGGNLVYSAGSSPTPPTPPTGLIPYIRNTDLGAFIDTGITPDNTTKVIVWARNFNPNALFLFGSRVAYGDTAFGVMAANGSAVGGIRNTYGSDNLNAFDSFTLLSGYHKYELDAGTMKVDDVVINTSSSEFSGNAENIFLFGCNNGGNLLGASLKIDICACQIYKGGTLVRDFSPTQTPSIGLYDAVSGNLFTNDGSGSFTYGTFDSSAYTPLEYIECSGGQYFTTTESGKYPTSIVTKFRSTPPSAVWGHIIGGNNATQKCDVFTGNDSIKNARLYAILGTGSAGQIKTTSTSGYFDNRDIIVEKANNVFTGYESNASIGSVTGTTSTSFDTGIPMSVGALNNNGTITEHFYGRIYYVGVGGCNYVPAKVNNVAGMYDTYNDVFKASESGVPFVAGPTI